MEGLDAIDPGFIREKLADQHPQVRIAAIRASETLYKRGEKSLVQDIQALTKDPDPNVVIQVLMTAHLLQWPGATDLIDSTIAANSSRRREGNRREVDSSSRRVRVNQFTEDERKLLRHGEGIYKELCFACHGPDGRGMPVQGGLPGAKMAPSLAGSKTVNGYHDGMIDVVLKGLTGPLNGKDYAAQMVPMESNDNEWIAAVTSYIRTSFGNRAP